MAPLYPRTLANGQILVEIIEPSNSILHIRSRESAEIKVSVCGNCGYTEQFIDDVKRLRKYWQKGYR